jgi:ketosteroid isomerase-like protein
MTDMVGTMSEENFGVVVAALTALERENLDAFLDYFTDDIDYRPIEGSVDDPGPLHGKDAGRAYVQDWLDTFDDLHTEVVDLIDAGDDRVVAVIKLSGRAKLSGVETDLTYAVLYWIRDGKIARGREYATREEALEAALE